MAGSAQLWPGPRMRAFFRSILAEEPGVDAETADKFVETGPMVIYGNFYDKKVSMDAGFKNFIFLLFFSITKTAEGWILIIEIC